MIREPAVAQDDEQPHTPLRIVAPADGSVLTAA
jgi:hypothetical protein